MTETRTLSDRHRHELEVGSGITPGAIALRGYYTETDPAALKALGFGEWQCLVPALVVPMWGVDGLVSSYQIKPDNPRLNKKGKVVKYESLPSRPAVIDVPPCMHRLIDDPEEAIWITEGVKKVDSAAVRGLCCIGLMGVWNFRGENHKGGSVELSDWGRIAIKGRIFYIAFDSDLVEKRPVLQAMRVLAAMLRRRGAKDVRPIVIPAKGTDKIGLDDFFRSGGTPTDLKGCVDKELLRHDGIITHNRSLADISGDAFNAFVEANFPPRNFTRNGELCRVRIDPRGIPKIEAHSGSTLRYELARSASFIDTSRKNPIEISPPMDVVADITAMPEHPAIPPIEAVTRAPVMATDGSISSAPGYCPKTRFYVAAQEGWMVWQGSTAEAVSFLFDDMLADFPFVGDADRAHTLALMLLPIVRPYITGPTPLHLFDAPSQGTGKSKLAACCLMPTCGDQIGATSATRDEEEWRKKLGTALLEGRTYVFFDNLTRKLDSEALAGVLTATEWNDRSLGAMRSINVSVRCAWVATSNNAELSRDILRRTVWVRLDAGLERPEDRRGFRHEPLETWVSANRVKIVSALCHLVSNWVDQGVNCYHGRYLGSFEEWSKCIGGILQCANVPGFLGNINELRKAAGGDEDSAWSGFYQRWWDYQRNNMVVSVRASDVKDIFCEDESLAALLGDKSELSQKNRLGFLLKRRIGVVAGGFRVKSAAEANGSNRFAVERVVHPSAGYGASSAATMGVEGSCTTNSPGELGPGLGSNSTYEETENGSYGSYGSSLRASTHTHRRDAQGTENSPDSLNSNLEGEFEPNLTEGSSVDVDAQLPSNSPDEEGEVEL